MKAYVSLWSADLLAVGAAVDLIAEEADGLRDTLDEPLELLAVPEASALGAAALAGAHVPHEIAPAVMPPSGMAGLRTA